MFEVYSKESCPFCVKAVDAISTMGYNYEKFDIEEDVENKAVFKQNGFKTVPQVYHNGKHIGGYEALADYLLEIS